MICFNLLLYFSIIKITSLVIRLSGGVESWSRSHFMAPDQIYLIWDLLTDSGLQLTLHCSRPVFTFLREISSHPPSLFITYGHLTHPLMSHPCSELQVDQNYFALFPTLACPCHMTTSPPYHRITLIYLLVRAKRVLIPPWFQPNHRRQINIKKNLLQMRELTLEWETSTWRPAHVTGKGQLFWAKQLVRNRPWNRLKQNVLRSCERVLMIY